MTTTIQVGQILTYSHDVNLEAVGLPPAVSALISPTSVSPPGEASLSLRTGGGASEGDYSLVISGTAEADNIHTADVDLSISTALPPSPTLLSPPDGATDQADENPTFTWEDLPQAGSYSLQLAQAPTFGAPVIDVTGLLTNTYTHDSPLEPATCYFWRARGENGCGSGEWAAPFSFATLASQVLFSDDMESGGTQWTHQAAQGLDQRQLATARSLSPSHAWYTPDAGFVTDAYLWNTVPVPVDRWKYAHILASALL